MNKAAHPQSNRATPIPSPIGLQPHVLGNGYNYYTSIAGQHALIILIPTEPWSESHRTHPHHHTTPLHPQHTHPLPIGVYTYVHVHVHEH